MSHGPEHRTKIAIQALLTAYKDAGLPLWWYMPIPAMGSAGVPDIVACVDGTLVGIEAKAEKKDGGRKPTQRQLAVHDEIREAGGAVFVVGEEAEFNDLRLFLHNQLTTGWLTTSDVLPVPWRSEVVKTRRKPPPLRG